MHVRECVLACIRSFCLCLATTSARGADTMYSERHEEDRRDEGNKMYVWSCVCVCMCIYTCMCVCLCALLLYLATTSSRRAGMRKLTSTTRSERTKQGLGAEGKKTVCVRVCVCACVRVCVCACVRVCIVWMQACMPASVCVCVYVHVCICDRIWENRSLGSNAICTVRA